MDRKIAAILATDMVGFSRLVEADEIGILARQKRHLSELIEPRIAAHGGTIIKLTGDGLIAEFPSVVEAVQAAVSIQSEMALREADQTDERRISYRMAVHLGDVISDEGDIYGDGVNIAARLEGLAQPGGVVISGPVYDLLKAQIDVGYRSLGEKRLKNIATPVRVYQIVAAGEGPRAGNAMRRAVVAVASIVGILMLGLAVTFWSLAPSEIAAADPEKIAFSLPEKPSVAVAPFRSASDVSEGRNLSEGLSASLISTLTTSPDIIVIATGAMPDMRDLSVTEIAEKYGVQYVVDGSVQVDRDRLRVSVRLTDALAGKSIWADQWDRDMQDIFAVQDEITRHVFEELQVKLTLGEEARTLRGKLGSFENVQDWLEGRAHFHTETPEGMREAERLWRQILRRNPELAGPNELMAQVFFQRHMLRQQQDLQQQLKAFRYIEQAIRLGGDGKTYAYHGLIQYFAVFPYKSDPAGAYTSIEYALKLNPGDPEVLFYGGMVYAYGDRLAQGIEMMQRGLRLQPYHPPWVVGELCHALYQAGRFEEAKVLAQGVVTSGTKTTRPLMWCLGVLAAISGEEGDVEAAQVHIAQIVGLVPNASTRYYRYTLKMSHMHDQAHVDEFTAALQKAGLP